MSSLGVWIRPYTTCAKVNLLPAICSASERVHMLTFEAFASKPGWLPRAAASKAAAPKELNSGSSLSESSPSTKSPAAQVNTAVQARRGLRLHCGSADEVLSSSLPSSPNCFRSAVRSALSQRNEVSCVNYAYYARSYITCFALLQASRGQHGIPNARKILELWPFAG